MIKKIKSLLSNFLIKYRSIPLPVKASLWFLVMGVLQKALSFLSTPIFTRLMSPSEYGEYNVFNSWLNIITIFATFNLFSGVFMRGLIKYKDDREVFTSSIQGLTTFLVIITVVIYIIFEDFWYSTLNISFNLMILMFFNILLVASYNLWASAQRIDYKYKELISLTLLNAILITISGIIAVVFLEDKVSARIFSLVIINILTYSYIYFKQALEGKVFFNKEYWVYALKFNIPLLPHYLSQILLNQSDRIMINDLVGSTEAGIYSVAYSLSTVLLIVNTSILNTLNPWLYKRIEEKKYRDIESTSYAVLLMVAVLNLLLIILAPEAVAIMAPSEYQRAIWVIPPITASVFFIFMYSLFAAFEFYFERTQLVMVASVLGALINLLLNYIFIPIYGFIAAGYTTLICYIIYVILHYSFMRLVNKTHMDNYKVYDSKIIFSISIGFLILTGLFTIVYSYPVLRYSLLIIIVTLIYINKDKLIGTVKKIRNTNLT